MTGLKGRLNKRQRKQIPVMLDLATEIERQLDSRAFEIALPTLEPSLSEARHHAGRLKAFLADLDCIVELEHAEHR